ncbi:MAG: hypothetical protein ACI81P_002319, partial [Neolewinella sp.]
TEQPTSRHQAKNQHGRVATVQAFSEGMLVAFE